MNRRIVFYMVGQIIKLEAIMLLLPALVAMGYRESCVWSILAAAVVAVVTGVAMEKISKPRNQTFFAKEGFVIVAMAWLLMSAIGALPFVISGETPSYVDAFFETVSGFTTTGASILTDVEAMSRGILFWRSFTHWIGGMGVLVLIMAIIPTASGRSIHIMRAEMPGPIVGKLVPRIKTTAQILYLIYVVLTIVQIVLLLLGGMPPFESVVHALGTAGTGGFGVKADSMGSYSPYLQWVITIFMLIFGINFNLYYLVLMRRFREIWKSNELWTYLGIVVTAVVVISLAIAPQSESFGESFRLASFQVASIISTTGYATTDFNLWPSLAKNVLLLLMFLGACAGSTAGGLKISRVVLLFKMIRNELKRMLHPRTVSVVKFEGKQVNNATLDGVKVYFALYSAIIVILVLLLSYEPFDLETNLSAAAACFNNIGPGLGGVGPASSYAAYSPISKLVLSLSMLLGRLEIYPVLLALSPSTWIKH